MHFGFDDDQLALRDAVRSLLTKECPPEVVRAAWEAPPGELDRSVWDALGEMGVFHLMVPEAGGGLGLDERSLVLVLEETGYAGLPHPIVETAAVTIPFLAENTTLGLGDPADATLDSPVGRALTGSLVTSNLGGPNVPCAADADAILYFRDGNGASEDRGSGRSLYLAALSSRYALDPADIVNHQLVPDVRHPGQSPGTSSDRSGSDGDGFTFEPLDTVDRARRAARVTCSLKPGYGPGQHVLTDDPIISLAFDRGALGTAAQLVGLGQRMLDMTVAYVSERRQFGQAVGAFQAVKHHMADALKELAFARPAVYRAAHSIATGAPTRSRDVAMAKAMASDAAGLVGRQALQCHGAIGYTTEADLHLFLKRTWALATAWGDASHHRSRIAADLLPSATASDP